MLLSVLDLFLGEDITSGSLGCMERSGDVQTLCYLTYNKIYIGLFFVINFHIISRIDDNSILVFF